MRAARSIRSARLACAGLALTAVALLGAVPPSAGAYPPRRTVVLRPRPYALGVYVGSGNPTGANQFSAQVAAPVPYATEFLNSTSWASMDNPSWQLQQWAGTGYSVIWSVPMLPDSGASLAVGATGAYDSHFTALAQTLVAGGQRNAILRVGWEFNGFWYPWAANGRAAQFIAYWRDIVMSIRAVPGANFKFEWDPNRGDLGAGNLKSYYPGNQYVDYVGLDLYDLENLVYPGAQSEFDQIESEPYGLNWLASFARSHHVAMVFPEWGLGWGTCHNGAPVTATSGGACGGDNPVFVKDSSQWFTTHNVFEVTYWDYGTSKVTGSMNPHTRVALRTYWAPPAVKVVVRVRH